MNIKLQGYEKYQLEWMIEHGYSLKDLTNKLARIINEELTVGTNAYVLIDEAFDILENETGFKKSEIWLCKDEWENNEKESIIKTLLQLGLENGIIQLIESPHDGQVACNIGEYWFYFISGKDETKSLAQIKERYSQEKLVNSIYDAMMELDNIELDYYMAYIKEHLDNEDLKSKFERKGFDRDGK